MNVFNIKNTVTSVVLTSNEVKITFYVGNQYFETVRNLLRGILAVDMDQLELTSTGSQLQSYVDYADKVSEQ